MDRVVSNISAGQRSDLFKFALEGRLICRRSVVSGSETELCDFYGESSVVFGIYERGKACRRNDYVRHIKTPKFSLGD